MSAWKALYVLPLVGISLAATAETKVDYQYEGQQPEAVVDTLDGKDSKNSLPEPKSEFTRKNLREGRFLVDKENNTVTLIYFDSDCKELQVKYTGLDLNKNIYMHNGAIVTKEMQDKATFDDPDVVVIVAYLKDKNRVSAAITKTGPYVTGTINVNEEEEGFTLKSSIQVRTADEEKVEADANDLVIVVNGERMPEGFDLNTIDPKTIASMEVLKTEKALQEYGTDEGVIVITTGEPKKNDDGKKAVPFQQVAQKPGFNGGDANEFSKYVAQNVVYPERCRQSKIEGRVTLEFTVTETGKVADIKILRSVNPDLDTEAVRVVAQSPLWTPGRDENGKVVPVKYTFPVIFKLPDSDDSSHYLEADVKPTFNGGDANEFAKWVYSQLKYPEECMNAGITGRVSLSFIVGTDGKVRDVKVLRGAHEKLDAEAMRVLNMSPDWTPGTKDGKPVPVSFTFPVNFEIPDSENK